MSTEHPRIHLRCLIVDDEPNAVNLLEMFIQQNTSWDILAKCYDAREALTFLKTHTVDLIFLDINMPHLTGMEMAALLPPATRIVFTTAYSEFAAESYGFPTIDYLLKPITLKRFYAALQKIDAYFNRPDTPPGAAQQPASSPSNAIPQPPAGHLPSLPEDEYFFVKSGRALQKILLKDILYFEGEKEYVRVSPPSTSSSSTAASRTSKNNSPPPSPASTIHTSSTSPASNPSATTRSSSAANRSPSAKNSAKHS